MLHLLFFIKQIIILKERKSDERKRLEKGITMSTMSPIKDKKELEAMKKYFLGKNEIRNYALFCVGINTALRIGDILRLRWKDVYDFGSRSFKKHLQLKEQKTKKRAEILLNKGVINALKKLLAYFNKNHVTIDENTYIFTGRKNMEKPLSRSQAYRIINSAAKALKITGNIGCHSLRKTFGYFAARSGISSVLLMHIYNHSSFPITMRYLGIEQDERDEVFMRIAL